MRIFHRQFINRKYIYVCFAKEDREEASYIVKLLEACEFNVCCSYMKNAIDGYEDKVAHSSAVLVLNPEKQADDVFFRAEKISALRNKIPVLELCTGKMLMLDGTEYADRDALFNALIHRAELLICCNEPELLHGTADGTRIYIKDGFVFIDNFTESNKTGWARHVYLNGNSYEGNIVNGHYEGYGVYVHKGGSVYEGFWHDDKCEGYGVYFHKNKPWEGDIYEGEYKDDKHHGFGRYTRANGEYFEGEQVYGKGTKGKYVWPDGMVYEGEMAGDMVHGCGTLHFPSGASISGEWKDGRLLLHRRKNNKAEIYILREGFYTGEVDEDFERTG